MRPIVYLHEEQVNGLFNKHKNDQLVFDGNSFAHDGFSVIHAFTDKLEWRQSGNSLPCKFIVLDSVELLPTSRELISKFIKKQKQEDYLLLVFLALGSHKLEFKSFLKFEGETLDCELKFIPERSDLFSRSKGLLETDILSKKKVGIVGLGSGGSPIAVELAKAGVGKFVLIDYDRIELANVARHICGINDLGRLKTYAVRDAILQKNPHAQISTHEIDVNQKSEACRDALSDVNIIICASDNDRSRFLLNEISLKKRIPAIFGRAITRATGGDVLRVRPFQGPCYNCLYSQNIRQQGGDDEEVTQLDQAKKLLPDYTSENDLKTIIQVGLSSDIAPISNFMVKLALVELSKSEISGIKSLEEDLIADFYIWANRRENVYENWSKLEYNFNKPSILRWYGAKIKRDPNCLVCSI